MEKGERRPKFRGCKRKLGGNMKNKDRMQFNLKNWRKSNWSLWNKEDENKASFEKILNKDKYKKNRRI